MTFLRKVEHRKTERVQSKDSEQSARLSDSCEDYRAIDCGIQMKRQKSLATKYVVLRLSARTAITILPLVLIAGVYISDYTGL